MSYKFGQFRRGQLESYSTAIENSTFTTIKTASPLGQEGITFTDHAIILSTPLQPVNEKKVQKCYYLKFKVYKRTDYTLTGEEIDEYNCGSQIITIRLTQNESNGIIQKLVNVEVPAGLSDDYSIFDIVIAPNANYNKIEFILNRKVEDYSIKSNSAGTQGSLNKIEILRLEEIKNIIETSLSASIENKGALKQIGVQSAPGMQMCIDGESIKVGRSGIYEINNGVNIKFLGFIVEPDDKNYFILDYQY